MLTFIFSILIILLGSYLFTNMNRILNNKINTSTEQVFNHVEMEISGFFQSIEMSANTISYMQPVQDSVNIRSDSPSYELYNNMSKTLSSALISNHNIKSVILDLNYKVSPFTDMDLVLDGIQGIQVESYKTYYSNLLPFNYTKDPKALYYFAAVHKINNLRNLTSKEYSGNIILILNKSLFDDISSRYAVTENSKLYIINNHNEVIGRRNDDIDYNTENIILNKISKPDGTSFISIDDVKHIYLTRNVGSTGWRIVSLTPYNEYFKELNYITHITFITFFAVMVVMLGCSFLISRNINSPIQSLLQTMKNIKNGNLRTRCNLNLDNEIGELSNHFNAMMDEIHTLTYKIFQNQEKMYELELANKDARFMALQSQINPHFLYNALACIQGLSLHYEIDEITEVTQALANIFRYSIKENNYVTISAEIENINNYISIYRIKSAEKINFIIDIDPEIYCLVVPKLIIQPIVENAINHGLMKKVGGGKLVLQGYLSNNNITFVVSDDGAGMCEEQLTKLNSAISDTLLPSEMKDEKRSIGIVNIKQRLKLCYSSNYSFKIESRLQKGTKVTIQIPVEEVKNI